MNLDLKNEYPAEIQHMLYKDGVNANVKDKTEFI